MPSYEYHIPLIECLSCIAILSTFVLSAPNKGQMKSLLSHCTNEKTLILMSHNSSGGRVKNWIQVCLCDLKIEALNHHRNFFLLLLLQDSVYIPILVFIFIFASLLVSLPSTMSSFDSKDIYFISCFPNTLPGT